MVILRGAFGNYGASDPSEGSNGTRARAATSPARANLSVKLTYRSLVTAAFKRLFLSVRTFMVVSSPERQTVTSLKPGWHAPSPRLHQPMKEGSGCESSPRVGDKLRGHRSPS